MNIKFLQRKPRFQTLAFTALASLGACSSTPDETDGSEESASIESAGESVDGAVTGDDSSDLDLGDNTATADDTAEPANSGAGVGSTDQASNGGGVDRLFGQRRAPEVQRTPFQAEGRWMNAFHVVRGSNENWENLSQLIYGRPDRADLLAKWNQEGTLKVGRVVYYNSAIRPDDQVAMKVLADDFSIPLEKVEVQTGDSLSAIGARLYGNAQTWQEIAVLNPEITSPDVIQIGQVLNIQPAQLNTSGVLEQVVAQAAMSNPPAVAASTDSPSTADPVDPNLSSEQVAQADASAAVDSADQTIPAPTQSATINSGSSISSSGKRTALLTNVGIGLAALCLVGLLLRRWLANRKSRDDWSNDQLNVTKLSRPGN